MTKNNLISMEDFDKIVQIQEDHFIDNILSKPGDFVDQKSFDNARDLIIDEIPGLIEQYGHNVLKNRVGAILNPETRQYALENFVDKEEKYIFEYKKVDAEGDTYRLARSYDLILLKYDTRGDRFTKKQVKDAGYNLDKFKIISEG